MYKQLTTIFSQLEAWLKRVLQVTSRNVNLPCDSRSPKVCYCCHLFRAKFTGKGRPLTDRVIIFTRKQWYLMRWNMQDRTQVFRQGNNIVVSYQA